MPYKTLYRIFVLSGLFATLNSFAQYDSLGSYSEIHKPLMVADLAREQVKKECSFFGGDSLTDFDFEAASKQAEVEGDKMYMEFQSFMFRAQDEFIKKKYNVKSLPYEIAIEKMSSIKVKPLGDSIYLPFFSSGFANTKVIIFSSRSPLLPLHFPFASNK